MKNKLPNIYRENNIKSNNKKSYYSNNVEKIEEKNSSVKLQDLFASSSYIFNIKVLIITKNKEYNTRISGKIGNNIVTVNNDVIAIKDIIDIKLI